LFELAQELKNRPGVAVVVPFGNTLHVSGEDAQALERAIAAYRSRPDLEWRQAEPGLEDAFIHFMREAQDNYP
jgi:ABC-2 type transport system ATP-binding protein